MVKIRKLSFWEGEKMDKERLEQLNNKFNAIRANGGIMPQAQGDDYNNDIINLVPSKSVKTFEIGRDEQDNPIMSSDAATALGKPAEQETGKNWLDNINSAISKPTPAEDLRKYEALLDQEGELTSFTTPSIDLSEEGFKDWLKDTEQLAKGIADSMDSFKASRLYANLFYGKDALQERIHKISQATGIGESVLASNDDVYQHGEKLLQQLEKYEKIPSMLTTDGKLDMQKVYQEMPYLKILQEKHGDVTAAMAMANAKGLMTINDVYKNEFERFAASVGFGLDKGWNNLRRQYTYGKAMLRGLTGSDGRLTVDEKSFIDQLNKENAERPDYSYSGIGSGLGAMIGGAAENLPMILSSQGIAKVSGVTAGFVAKRLGASNAMAYKVYNWVSNAVGVGVMGLEIGGGQYEENLYKLDKNGNLMYTPRQAAAISLLQGVSEGVLEQYSLNQIGRAVFGGKELIPIAELWKKAPELAATEGMKTAEEATRRFIADKIADAAKRNLIIFRSELQEEFTQQVSDMVIENMAQVVLKGDQAELSSAGEILTKSLGAAMVAVPSILGFSFIGGVGLHPIANAKSVLGARQRIAQLMTNDLARAVHENTHQINTIDGVARNLDNIAELNQKAPEVQRDILDDMNRRFGMENTDVDIKTLYQQEGGEAVVNAIAEKAGITADELQACAQGTGMLRVKTSVIQETVHDMQDNEPMVTELYRNLAKDETVLTSHKAEEVQKRSREIIKKMQDIAKKTHEQEINTIVAKDFNQSEAEAKEARSILEVNYDNAEKEYKRRLNDVNSRIMDIIGPVLKELKSGMRQGVDIVRVEGERDAHYEKVSNNDEWARNYYEDYGHWPNERELVDLAIDIAAGRQNPRYGLMDYQNNTEESRQQFAAQAAELDELVERRDLLEGMKDRFEGMKAGDRAAQAMLSPEGLEVYELAKKEFAASQNKEVRAAAKEQALAYARYCDLMAQNYAEVYNRPFTAKDYMNEILHVNVNAVEGKAPMQNAAQLMQIKTNIPGWKTAKRSDDVKKNLRKITANRGKTLTNKDYKPGARLSGKKLDKILNKIKNEKQELKAGISFEESFEIVSNIDTLFEMSHLNTGNTKNIKSTSVKNRKEFRVEIAGYIVLIYTKKIVNQDVDVFDQVKIRKSVPKGATNGNESIYRWQGNAFTNNIADNEDKSNSIITLEGIKNSYVGSFAIGNVDALEDANDAAFDQDKLIDDVCTILEELGGKQKGKLSRAHSAYYILNGNLIRIADHESNQPNKKQDWDAQIVLTNSNILNQLVNIKTKEELKQYILNSIAEQTGSKTLNQSAFHGTGARFDRFDTGFMGTGEGNQVHGWGLYFAADRKIAESYRNMLTNEAQNAEWAKLMETKFSGKTIQEWYDEYGRRLDRMPGSSKDYHVTQQIYELLESALLGEDIQRVIEEAEEDGGYDPKALKWLRDQIANKYTKKQFGQVFEADIPENDVLLDEQKTLAEQPKKVQQAIRELVSGMTDEQLEDTGQDVGRIGRDKAIANILKQFEGGNGKQIYGTLTDTFGGQREASLKLNEYGVKGITYEGVTDGRCFVVFDDNAISILDKYYQQQGGVKGSTSFSETSPLKIVSLFQTADRSTFMHEMSHVYLLDLERLAAAAPDSRFAKDYVTVMAWASWKKGMAEEYKGTASYEEFKKREQNILEAQIKGDTETEQKLLNEWAQERFARGFEEYLRKGEAPAVGLQNAFRNFKRWLTKIYKSFIGAGVRATPEVEAVMGRMLASEEEIQVMDEIMEGNRLAGLDGLDMMPTDVAAMYSRWQEKARTQAEEQLLKELLKDYKKNVQDRLKEHEEALREELTARLQQDEPCYAVDEAVADGTDLNSALFMFNLTSREYEKRKKELGGDLEKAVEKQVKKEIEEFRRQMPDDKMLHDQAMQALYSGDYQTRLAELERKILRAYKDRYMEAPQMLQKGLHELDNAREKAKPELMKRKLAELKYSIRWNDDQWNIVKEMEDLLALETGDTVSAEKLDAFDRKYNELKASTVQNKDWLRKVRGGTMEQVEAWKRAARFRLEEMNLRDAMNYEHWIREGEKQAAVAGQEFSKAQKNKGKEGAKHAEKAEQAKQRQAAFVAMTAESIAMKKKVGQWIGRIRNRQKSMATGKEKMDPNLRYFHDHILWVYGLAAADARKPVTLGKKQFMDVMRDLMTEELQLSEEQLPAWLVKAADDVERDSKGYNGLTMSDFQDLMNFTTWLYTLSKNQQKLLTMDVSLEQVEGDCFKDWSETIYLSRQTASDVKKQLGRYMAMIVKPETWLNVLGGKEGAFIRYIYMPLLKAAEAEEIAQEKEAKFLRGYDVKKEDGTVEHVKGLFERFYTKEELRHIANDKLYFENGEAVELHYPGEADYLSIRDVTKENILCMALNWGNRTNRSRLCKSLGIEDEEFFQHQYLEPFMTANDWAFVQAMWDHINEFADSASEVLEKATGIPMKRVEADAFSVKTEDGEVAMKGGYYPIVKDVDRSMREVEFEKMEQAQSMGGASVFGVGMGSTKERSASREISDPLLLELRVASSHIKGMIHIINSRLAVRDAYKVLHNKQIQTMIVNTLNQDAYKAMDEWVLANWHAPIQPTDIIIEKIAKVRSRTVGAIMAYRVSTALLNAANFVYIAQEIGWTNMGRALFDYYKDWKENSEFVRNASVYMRNRDTNMDRDLNTQADELMKHHGRLMNKLNDVTGERADELSYFVGKYANWLIEKTDAALSKPLYLWQYKQTYNAAMQEGKSAQEAGEAANLAAVRTVTHVFSSSRKVDSSAVQRSRSELVKMLTPFFSFSNMMMNAVWSKWYEGKYQGRKVEVLDEDGNVKHNEDGSVMYTTVDRSFRERYAGFVWAAIQNYMIGALVETMIREAINAFTGSGDDDDYLTRVLKKYPKNVIDSAIGGFAGINVLVDPVAEFWLNYLIEGKIYYQFSSSGGRSSAGVLGGAAKRFYNVFVEDAGKLLKGSQKFDTLDLMRDVVKLGNSVSGFSDTLTDALFNTARFAVDDYRLNNMDDLREYIAKTLFDRKLKKRD